MRAYTEKVQVITGQALTPNGRTVFTNQLPLGEGWYRMDLTFYIVLTLGTGAGVTAGNDYELRVIRGIQIRTDRGEIIVNLPGRALHKIAWMKAGTQPHRDVMAAVGAPTTYIVHIPIYFADPWALRPEDTVLDTSRYNSVTLDVSMGPAADLLDAIGTGTYTATMDCNLIRSKGPLDKEAKPIAHISYDFRQPIDASVGTVIDLERATDLWLRRLYIHESVVSAVVNPGQPCWGINSNAIQNIISVRDQSGFIVQQRTAANIAFDNKIEFGLESYADDVAAPANAVGNRPMAGWYCHDFMEHDDSANSALFTGNKSILQYSWTNVGGPAAGSFITAVTESHRTLK